MLRKDYRVRSQLPEPLLSTGAAAGQRIAVEGETLDFKNGRSQASLFSETLFAANILGAFSRALCDKIEGAICQETGLSPSACAAIITVGTEPNAPIETLRKMLSLEHSSTVRLLTRLEEQGYLMRERGGGGDRREVRVSLTDAGETVFNTILDARGGVLEAALNPLSDAERQQLTGLVRKLMPKVTEPGDDQHYVCRLCDMEVCPQEMCPVNCAFPEFYDAPITPFRRPRPHAKAG